MANNLFSKMNILKKNNTKVVETNPTQYRLSSDSEFMYTESYNHLRTNVMFTVSALKNKKKVVVVSSCNPNEGKTTTSTNLAISLAKLKKKVLIIDADMRKPSVHKVFGVKYGIGLSDVLLGASPSEAIIGIDGLNLDFLPAGTIPPMPGELLASALFSDLIAEFEQIYDYIIVDTPPILVVSDALSIAGVAAGMLLVCKYMHTTYPEIEKALVSLKLTNFNLLGSVIVGTKSTSHLKAKKY